MDYNIRIGQRVRVAIPLPGNKRNHSDYPVGIVVAKTTTDIKRYRENPSDDLELSSLFDGWFRVKFPAPVDMGDGQPVISAICMPGELLPAA